MVYVGHTAAKIFVETIVTKQGIDIARGSFVHTNSIEKDWFHQSTT